ncbi:hypothetical protein PT7_2475 [Pusillimonas sp. T7-7]|nr:hypothetical protein PT7_2475 [Pusillimonas sp. T7-7]
MERQGRNSGKQAALKRIGSTASVMEPWERETLETGVGSKT